MTANPDEKPVATMRIISATTKAYRAPKEGPICTVKEGSQIALWSPHGFPEALIIVHPDDAPRLVYFDGTEETLKVGADGVICPPPICISMPGQDVTFDVGTFDDAESWSAEHGCCGDDPDPEATAKSMAENRE